MWGAVNPPGRDVQMPQFIGLVNWTDQGAQKATESVGRAKAFEKMATEMGCKVHGLFYTMGQYDLTIRIEAPDAETVSAVLLKVAQLGNVRSVTLPAFTEEEFEKIVKKVTG